LHLPALVQWVLFPHFGQHIFSVPVGANPSVGSSQIFELHWKAPSHRSPSFRKALQLWLESQKRPLTQPEVEPGEQPLQAPPEQRSPPPQLLTGAEQVPFPLQRPSAFSSVLLAQPGSEHLVSLPYCWQPPAPSQAPLFPQLVGVWAGQSCGEVVPRGTGEQVPVEHE
jgi:hypothetical protein